MMSSYFTIIFTEDRNEMQVSFTTCYFPTLTNKMKSSFCRNITKEEVCEALFDIAPYKALGHDGFHAWFYQNAWNIVGDDLTTLVEEFTKTGHMLEGLNDTFITLIPKVKRPEKVNQLRPISLCNVVYKLITKVIANRLKEVIGHIIEQEQSSFVPGRQIVDNIAFTKKRCIRCETRKVVQAT